MATFDAASAAPLAKEIIDLTGESDGEAPTKVKQEVDRPGAERGKTVCNQKNNTSQVISYLMQMLPQKSNASSINRAVSQVRLLPKIKAIGGR